MKKKVLNLGILSIFATVFSINATMVPTPNTIAMWDMDSRSSTRVFDINNRTNDLVLYSSPSTPSFAENLSYDGSDAISFDGIDDRSMSNLKWDTSNDTLVFDGWINPARIEAFSGNEQIFFHINNSVALKLRGSRFYMSVFDSSTSSTTIETSTSYTSGNWYHINAVILANGDFSITVDDETIEGSTGTGGWNILADNMYLGTSRYNTANFEGMMDNVHISTIPEPATILMLGLGSILFHRKKK